MVHIENTATAFSESQDIEAGTPVMNEQPTAIVTGGASGIGLALCQELTQSGIHTVMADINQERLEQASWRIRDAGGSIEPRWLDVSKAEEVKRVVQDTVKKHGRLDYMFNNAGISVSAEVRDMSLEHWQRLLDVNLNGVIYGSISAYEVMIEQGHGHIVNISSLQGIIPLSLSVGYTTTKYGVVGFSLALRPEAAFYGVGVTVVCPGFIETEILNDQPFINIDKKKLLSASPRKKMCPQKCARKIVRGVNSNKPMIMVPFYSYMIWVAHRIFPFIMPMVNHRLIKNNRDCKFLSS
ncbi:MAG TPA: SDR family oxidoreductase [bacterium]|nr:SDR family oxidoreductase [bacterium]